MQFSPGQIILQSQLWSEDGVIRNADGITNAGNTFCGSYYFPATAGNYAAIQLLNPVGSGVTAFVDGVLMSCDSIASIGILSADNAFGNAPDDVICMRAGQYDGACIIDGNDQAIPQDGVWMYYYVLANTPLYIPFPFPIQLDAGRGIAALCNVAAKKLIASFYLREFS